MRGRNRRRRNDTSSSLSNARQMMNLSLFIMLLAFFIVLNSMSSYEEIKSEQVRRSLNMAFSKEEFSEVEIKSTTQDLAQAIREGHVFDRLDALFQSQISAFSKISSKRRGVMMVELDLEEFTTAILKVGQKDFMRYPSRKDVRGNFFLPTLVSIIRSDMMDMPIRMEILINSDQNPAELQNQLPVQMDRTINLGSALTERLESQGMPTNLINIGVKEGDPKKVTLAFRKHTPFSLDAKEGQVSDE